MIYVPPRICPGEWDTQNSLRFWDTNGLPDLGKTTKPSNSEKKPPKKPTKNLPKNEFYSSGWPLRKTERKAKREISTLILLEKWKKLWNMKVIVIAIVIGALGTVIKGLVQGLPDLEVRRRVEKIQTTALLRWVSIVKVVLETWGDLLSLRIQWKTIS